jgi:hypothetical protein
MIFLRATNGLQIREYNKVPELAAEIGSNEQSQPRIIITSIIEKTNLHSFKYFCRSLVELVNITLFSLPPPTTLPCCYIFHFNSELKHLHHRSLSVSEPKSLQLELSAAGPFLAHKFQQTNPPDHHHTTRRSEDASSQAQILQVQVLVVAAANGTRRISFSSLHQLAS